MKDRDNERHYAYEAMVIMGLLALLLYITRLWPILLLVILGIFIAALRLLFLSSKRIEPLEPLPALPEPQKLKEPSEQDMQNMAYFLIQKRITEILLSRFPDCRWIWENAYAKEDIQKGNKVYVLLNKAGGYRKGLVVIQNYHVCDIIFEPEKDTQPLSEATSGSVVPHQEPSEQISDECGDEIESNDIPEDYGLLAFQWVDAHIIELNERINEAIGQRKTDILITAEELPVRASWMEICQELERNDLTGASCRDDGILIEFEQ